MAREKLAEIGVKGHYEDEKTPAGNRRVWVPDQIIVECNCGERIDVGDESSILCRGCQTDHTTTVREVEQALAENSITLKHRNRGGEISARPVYKAVEIVDALVQETTVNNGASPLLFLDTAIVVGKLDLKHRTIDRHLEAKNCWFLRTVDLRNCDFEQSVHFVDCIFFGEFNSGDTIEYHTIYRKELNCTGSSFKKAASFNGIQVESTAYFHNSIFELENPRKCQSIHRYLRSTLLISSWRNSVTLSVRMLSSKGA